MTSDVTSTAPRATRREWLGLAVLALPCLLYSMDLTVLNLAVPKLTTDLLPSATQLLWAVDIYGFVLAGALIPMGVLGDRIGRRRLLLCGAVAFGLASVLAAFAPTIEALIAARALLGLAAATLAPSTLSLLRAMFADPAQRTFAVAVWIASFSAGGAVGPLVGGVLLQHFWWGSVFLVNVPVMLLLLATGPRLLPEYVDPDAGKPDLASAALCVVAVLAVVFGIKHAAADGIDVAAVAAVAAGVLVGAAFVRRQRRLAQPFVDLALFRRPTFTTALAINLMGFFVAFGSFLLIAQYLQLVLGLSPLAAGLWSAPSGLAFVLGAMLTPRLVARMSPARLIAAGFVLAAVGFAVLAQAGTLAVVVAGYVLFSLGLAPAFTLAADLVVSAAPENRAGAAAGLSEMSTELGGALGIAVLGSLTTVVYRLALGPELGALPSEAIDGARDTLGGALHAARSLPDDQAAWLADTARDAFTRAFRHAALAACAVALLVAVATLRVLRDPPARDAALADGDA